MSEYRHRVKLVADLEKIRKNGMKPYEAQKSIYDFFKDKGFSYQRHLGFIYERELTAKELDQINVELDNNGFQYRFDWRNQRFDIFISEKVT